MSDTGTHYHVLSGLVGGYLPTHIDCLRDIVCEVGYSPIDAWRDWVDELLPDGCECDGTELCAPCATRAESASIAADSGTPWVMVGEWEYVSLELVCDSDCEGESDEGIE